MPKTILIAGYFGFGNTGDEAILAATLANLRALRRDLELCVISGNPDHTQKNHRVSSVLWTDLPAIIQRASECDLILLGGGGFFHDYWGVQPDTLLTRDHGGLTQYCELPILASLLGKPIMVYAVGVGPLFSKEGKKLTRLSFELGNLATVRDVESSDLLKSLDISVEHTRVTADAAFSLSIDRKRSAQVLADAEIPREKPVVGVCLRNWGQKGRPRWLHHVSAALDQFIEAMDCSIVFIPFQKLSTFPITNDLTAAEDALTGMVHSEKAVILRGDYSPEVIAGLEAQCDLIVGMRLHSVIFAAMAGVPVVGLIYDPKVKQMMSRLSMSDYALDLTDLTVKHLVTVLDLAWKNRARIKENLTEKAVELKALAEVNAKMAVDLLNARIRRISPPPEFADFVNELALKQTMLLYDQNQKVDALLTQLAEKNHVIEVQSEALQAQTDQLAVIYQKVDRLLTQLDEKNRVIEVQSEALQAQTDQLADIYRSRGVNALLAQLTEKNQVVKEQSEALQAQTDQLADIYRSRGWKLLLNLWKLRLWLAPHGSGRERFLKQEWSIHRVFRKLISYRPAIKSPRLFTEKLSGQDNSRVTLYTDNPSLLSTFTPRKPLPNLDTHGIQVTLIASVKNEVGNVEQWLDRIQNQTRPPDEIVIVDGGSTDGTDARLEDFARRARIPVKLLRAPGANIAEARNLATEQASHPIIAVTDFGCYPDLHWLERLLQPFISDPETQVSAGFYRTVDWKGRVRSGNGIWPGIEEIEPQYFLPSSRSVAFQKAALEAVGGHPEWLTLTGDDTYLDFELKALGGKWAFVPEAIVDWNAPDTLGAYLKKMYRWAVGDGEAGIHGRYYWRNLLRLSGWAGFTLILLGIVLTVLLLPFQPVGLWIAFIIAGYAAALFLNARLSHLPIAILVQRALGEVAQLAGFINGARRQAEVDRKRFEKLKGVFFILAGVPIDDTGGGARSAQIALELLRRGFGVVYINKFPKNESKDLNLLFAHPNLFTFSVSNFVWGKFLEAHPNFIDGKQITALIEFPLPEFLPLIKNIQNSKGIVVYDLQDDWKTSLGGQWYSPEVERQVIRSSQVLVATTAPLKEHLEQVSGRKADLIPNAVNDRLFVPAQGYGRPADLPGDNRWIIIYIGALWGEWFDWDLLRRTADEYPDAAVVVIGDYRGQMKHPPPNLHFLGLKAQKELPAYLSYANVAIIPWKVNQITEATSPLKVYESLAMGLPVVAPSLKPLQPISGVFLARDADEFVALVGQVRNTKIRPEAIATFLQNNNWQARISQLLIRMQNELNGGS